MNYADKFPMHLFRSKYLTIFVQVQRDSAGILQANLSLVDQLFAYNIYRFCVYMLFLLEK